MPKVVVGMSGGVDSSLTALLLKNAGDDVCGVFLVTRGDPAEKSAAAAANAASIGIDFQALDVRELFEEKVINPFRESYLSGLTPNPCVECNRFVKFPSLLRAADLLGAKFAATGHYAKIIKTPDGPRIARGADLKKDQSYFLYRLRADELERIIFPLGDMTKDEVRRLAKEYGLPSSSASDSQDVCFLPDGGSGDFVSEAAGDLPRTGEFTDASGRLLGRHRGYWYYTPGQRRGLGVSSDARLYVQKIIPGEQRVILGPESDLYRTKVEVRNVSYPGATPSAPFRANVVLRYSKKASPATVIPDGDSATVEFDLPQRAPAPGQSAVFYDGDAVVGGGIIV